MALNEFDLSELLDALRAGGVQLVISDHHLGLKEAVPSVFVGSSG